MLFGAYGNPFTSEFLSYLDVIVTMMLPTRDYQITPFDHTSTNKATSTNPTRPCKLLLTRELGMKHSMIEKMPSHILQWSWYSSFFISHE